MGMSAGQARLLSITARLTDNELRSQSITNSKLRLAEKSSEASGEYMNALNTQELSFRYFNNNGDVKSYSLTPAFLYSYEPLKNQYALQNVAGQTLVSATDAANFEKSKDLYSFLGAYGLIESEGLLGAYQEQKNVYDKYVSDLEDFNKKEDVYKQYQEDYKKYLTNLNIYNNSLASYDERYKKYEQELKNYEELKALPDLYKPFVDVVGTSENPKSCYKKAKNGDAKCFTHLLDYLINYNVDQGRVRVRDLTTSTGKTFTTVENGDASLDHMNRQEKEVFQQISENLDRIKCDGDDNISVGGKQNSLKEKVDAGETPSELDLLRSDYKLLKDQEGNVIGYEAKTLKEKAIDMYYIILKELVTDQETMNEMLDNFTDGDMQKLTPEKPVPPTIPTEPTPPTVVERPEMPDEVKEPIKPKFDVSVNDKDKAQWYVNLWYLMNGSSSANKLQSTVMDDKTLYGVNNCEKDQSKQNYKVIDENLFANQEWLQFALTNGVVSLSQAAYFNPSENSNKLPEMTSEAISWGAIMYSSSPDIISRDNEKEITKAEVKYKKIVKEIENQDKKYDQDLKKLDTEHTALKTEYDTLKGTIDKNIERSFKAFS